jgi:hypothetical protein
MAPPGAERAAKMLRLNSVSAQNVCTVTHAGVNDRAELVQPTNVFPVKLPQRLAQ